MLVTPRAAVSLALAFLCWTSHARGEIRRVAPVGGDHATIQAAVDASADGDLIVVAPGVYPGFRIDGKALDVLSFTGAEVVVQGTVTVENLPVAAHVLLAGLRASGADGIVGTPAAPGLLVRNNLGAVRVQTSTWIGGKGQAFANGGGWSPHAPGAPGVRVESSLHVTLADATARGGIGGGENSQCFDCAGASGGDGISTATSALALYDCLLEGGRGGNAGAEGGTGGAGARIESWGLFAAGCAFRGGDGGEAWDFLPGGGGAGGPGIVVPVGTGARLLDNAYLGGAGGECWACPTWGPPGAGQSGGGLFLAIPGQARSVRTSAIADASLPLSIRADGTPGDRVYVVGAGWPAFRFKHGWNGVWLVPFPAPISVAPLGTIGGSGSLEAPLALAPLSGGATQGRALLQGLVVSSQGVPYIGNPLTVARVACASLAPDCDGDGLWDACTLGMALDVDCNGNAVPDGCEPDCNGNGIADACDISSAGSADLNGNGVPDECEPQSVVWHVDAGAAPGGDGSAASPFQHPSEAFAVAISGHTVRLADGVYGGFPSLGLSFGGRDLVVESANGPAACVIDLGQAGRAFRVENGESPAARIAGLTIRNGKFLGSAGGAVRVVGASPTIADCVFESNRGFNQGGALYLQSSSSRIERCTFRANTIDSVNGTGGAVYALISSPTFVACDFVSNAVNAFHLHSPFGARELRFVGCRFVGNSDASSDGGALEVHASPETVARIENSLFADNVALRGAAITANCTLEVSGCTIVRNQASVEGGGIRRTQWFGTPGVPQAAIRGSILWGNVAPSGPQIAIVSTVTAVSVDACDVEGGQALVTLAAGATLAWGANLDLDPLFVSPSGPDGNPSTFGDNDWRLALPSPCIDAGANALAALDGADQDGDGITTEPAPYDLDLAPRFADVASVPDTGSGTAPIVDIGCHERQR